MSFYNIPQELRALPQWVCWKLVQREGLKPTKLPIDPKTGELADTTNPATWATFEQAVNQSQRYNGIGFVFSANDPYAGIDLDDTHGDADAFARQIKVYNEFASYSELSPSGSGLHIIIKAKLPGPGRRRASIELYDKDRYFTFTGNIYNASPIAERQELATLLYEQMGGPAQTHVYGEDQEQKHSDEEIITMACHAANGDKFQQLFAGHWDSIYPSQSEADFALIDIVAFYTQNRQQIHRIFAASQLGKNPKDNYKHRSDRVRYVQYMVDKSFDRQLPPVDIDGLRAQLEAKLAEAQGGASGKPSGKPEAPTSALQLPSHHAATAAASDQGISPLNATSSFPPGLVGEIAKFIYMSAPRPVAEIAVAGAFGLMAGICGRQYNISGSGLNQYILLIADTGRGKEAIANGISKLMRTVMKTVPGAASFEGPTQIASPQALSKWFSQSPCFFSILGEVGLLLKQLSDPHAPAHVVGLKRSFLDLYHKSGAGSVWGAMAYSKKEDNTAVINSPSFTLIGESTPIRFYENINEEAVLEGLVSRFTIFEYGGDQVPVNKDRARVEPSFALVQKLSDICAHVQSQASLGMVTEVGLSPEAEAIFDKFEEFARHIINNRDPNTGLKRSSKPNSIAVELWNRAHIKALRLAAIVSVGINYTHPVISAEIAQAATNEIYWQTIKLKERFDKGEIGGGAINHIASEEKQLDAMCKTIARFAKQRFKGPAANYRITDKMQDDKVFPFNNLLMQLQIYAQFKNDRRGPSEAIRRCYQQLIDNDDIREVPKEQMLKEYGKRCRAFMVNNPERFIFEDE